MGTSLSKDKDWLAFAEAVRPEFGKCTFQKELIAACGGAEDIAWAVFFHHGAHALEWLNGKVPFLNNGIPSEMIRRGRGDRVRRCLWQTP